MMLARSYSKKFLVRTITHVFIGRGEKLEPYEYYVDSARVYRVDIDELFTRILERNEDAAQRLEPWIEEMSGKILEERDNRKQSQLRDAFTVFNFIKHVLDDKDLESSLRREILDGRTLVAYTMEYESLSTEGKKRKKGRPDFESSPSRKKEYHVALKTACNELYIPGSSIKGALRRALLFRCISEADDDTLKRICSILLDKSERLRANPSEKEGIGKELSKEVEETVFNCGFEKQGKDGKKYFDTSDARFDILKFLHVSDTNTVRPEEHGVVVPVDVYQANGEIQTQTPAVETIRPGVTFETVFSFDTPAFLAAYNRARPWEWKEIRKKAQTVYGIKEEDVKNLAPEEIGKKALQKVLDDLRTASKTTARRDEEWRKRSGHELEALDLDAYQSILRLGYAGGFHNTTIYLAMLEKKHLKGPLEEIMRLLEIGVKKSKNTSPTGSNKLDMEKFPSSRRLATLDSGKGARGHAFGWLALHDPDAGPPPWEKSMGKREAGIEEGKTPEPQRLSKVKDGQEDVPALVKETKGGNLLVEIWVEGYEGSAIKCTGVREGHLSIGEWVRVQVILDKKTKRVQSTRFLAKL